MISFILVPQRVGSRLHYANLVSGQRLIRLSGFVNSLVMFGVIPWVTLFILLTAVITVSVQAFGLF